MLEPIDLGDHLGGWVRQQVSDPLNNWATRLASRAAKPALTDLLAIVDLVDQRKALAQAARRAAQQCEEILSHNKPPGFGYVE